MAREVRVTLTAEISAYLASIDRAASATDRLASSVENLDSSAKGMSGATDDAASSLDDTAASADSASSSMDDASASAEGAASGMQDAGAAAQGASGGLDDASASASSAGASLDDTASSATGAASGLEQAGASAEGAAGGISQVGAQSQDVTAAMLEVSAAAQGAGAGFDTAAASGESAAAGMSTAGAAGSDAAAGLDTAGAAGEQAAAGMESAASSGESAGAGLESAGSAGRDAAAGLETAGAAGESAAAGMESAGAAGESAGAGMSAAGAAGQDAASGFDASAAAGQSAAAGIDQAAGSASSFDASASSAAAGAQDMAGGLGDSAASAQDFAGSAASAAGAAADLGAGAQNAAGGLSDIGAGAATAAGGLADAEGSARGFLSQAQGMTSEFRTLGTSMAVVGGGVTALMTSVITTGIEYNTLQQVAGRAMETITGNAEAAANQMDRLHEFADTSPFARDVWITAQQQLMAFGLEAEDVVGTLEGVQNAVAAIGGGDQEIMRLVDILGTVQGQGRMTGVELRRMGQMGIDAADIMADAMGVTADEIRTQISAGTMDASTAIGALADGMNTRFAGAAEGLRDTMTGALDRIRARIRDLGSILATPLVSPEGGGFLVEAINQAADFGARLLELPDPLLQVGGLLIGAAGGFSLLGGAIVAALPHITGFAANIKTAWTMLGDFGGKIGSAVLGLGRLSTGAKVAVGALAGLAIIAALTDSAAEFAESSDQMGQRLVEAARGGEAFANVEWERGYIGEESITSLDQAMERLANRNFGDTVNGWVESLVGVGGPVQDIEAHLDSLSQAMSESFNSGDFENAAAGFRQVEEAARANGIATEELMDLTGPYIDTLRAAATEAGHNATEQELLALAGNAAAQAALANGESWTVVAGLLSQGADATYEMAEGLNGVENSARNSIGGITELGDKLGMLSGVLEEQASALETIVSAYTALGLIQLDATMAAGALEESFRALDGALEDNGASFDVSTEAGYANMQAMADVGQSAWDLAEANLAAGDSASSVTDGLQSTYNRLVETAQGMGLTASEAESLAREIMLIPEGVDTEAFFHDFATDGAESLRSELEGIPEIVESAVYVTLDGATYQLTRDMIDSIEDRTVGVYADDEGTIMEVQGGIDGMQDGTAWVHVGDDGSIREVEVEIQSVENGQATILVDDGETVREVQTSVDNIRDGSAFIDISDNAAESSGRIDESARDRSSNTNVTDNAAASGSRQDNAARDRGSFTDVLDNATISGSRLDSASRDRGSFTDVSDNSGSSSGRLDSAAKDRMSFTDVLDNSVMSDSRLDSASRDRSSFTNVGDNASSSGGRLDSAARNRTSTITASAATATAEAALNRLARTRSAAINITRRIFGGNADGGRVDAGLMRGTIGSFSTGGRLPSTGLGTDQIVGMSWSGRPTAMVDDREWVINRRSSDKYDSLLAAINADSPAIRHLAHLADGGRVERAVPPSAREWAMPRQAPQPAAAASQAVDTAAIGREVRSALSDMSLSLRIGQRDFSAAVIDANQHAHQMGGSRR